MQLLRQPHHNKYLLGVIAIAVIMATSINAIADSPLPQTHYRLTRLVSGWLPYWLNKSGEGDGWKVVSSHLNVIDEVSFFSAETDGATGELTWHFGATPNALNSEIATLHENNVAALVTVTQFNQVHELLSDPAHLAKLEDGIVRVLNRYNLDGVDIDFEDFKDKDPADTLRYTQFMTDLANRLHQRTDSFGFPTLVAATILSRTDRGHFTYADERALALSPVDQVRIMAYDENSPGSATAGACAPLPWVEKVAGYLRAANVPTWKFILGVPGYGYQWNVQSPSDWTTLAKGVSVTYPKVQGLIQQQHIEPQWNNTQAAPYLSYTDAGKTYIAFYQNARSWQRELTEIIAPDAGQPALGGMAEWAFGDEDPTSWTSVRESLASHYSIYAVIGLCYARYGGGARFGEALTPEENCGDVHGTVWNAQWGRTQVFQNATFYYQMGAPRAYFLTGEILRQYQAQGGPSSALGFPIADAVKGVDGVLSQRFEHGKLAETLLIESRAAV